ncbi:Tm-1-like ATP-binding domain-containing protein [Lunatibacter salilacus]|uniref:Tm-1-like ATP-binding domain-containing protein n=1 Tax=Lunatibacter salilacus TaxID=2483804 RepID=UPI00131E2533|nr:Tm-1-like ATP-binding domain-containing protein [Lunatibacter salilacus]
MPQTNTNQFFAVIGCFDTKPEVFAHLRRKLEEAGESVEMVNVGIMGSTDLFPIAVESVEIAERGGANLESLREKKDRGWALERMAEGCRHLLQEWQDQGKLKGVIGMGGGGGTFVFLSAIQSLPLGLPKVIISTLATKDVSKLVGAKDVVLIPSVVDVAGINSVIEPIINQAAAALVAMAKVPLAETKKYKGTIAISMFGNTTDCVNTCTHLLEAKGYEVMAFHANGIGGKAMEALIREGVFDAVMDLTTTELADEFCGGILSAGPDRMKAAVEMNLPLVIAPGCLDMVNFGEPQSIPDEFVNRTFYHWAPNVTLMRTNRQENQLLGNYMATITNPLKDKVAVIFPTQGFSQVGETGGKFYNPEADNAWLLGLREKLDSAIPIIAVESSINHPDFAHAAVNQLIELIEKTSR